MKYCDQYRCPNDFPWRYSDIIANDHSLLSVMFSNQQKPSHPNAITQACKQQLDAYFRHQLKTFNLPLSRHQHQGFASLVWQELLAITYGTTHSYGKIAEKLGDKNKSRAVGRACGMNPISIIVPCHRVLSASGKLTGYAGGIATKQWLLDHEKG